MAEMPTTFDDSVAAVYARHLALVEHDLLGLLRAMPADGYGFRPRGDGCAEIRTFAAQAMHAATVIYLTAAIVLQERSPYAPGPRSEGPATIEGKDAIIGYAERAFAYARTAMASLARDDGRTQLKTYFGPQPRFEVAAGLVYHSYNHYGQMVVYARLWGVVPPAPPDGLAAAP